MTSGQLDGAQLRTVLGHYPSGVTVVTALDGDRPVGFACQSFHSLSLDPPMIVVIPARTSTTWPRIREAGRFCVNVLAEGQDQLCRSFAVSGGDKFGSVEWAHGDGAPRLAGVSAWIECELQAEYDGGDHTLAVGLVTALASHEERPPLIFHRGLFRQLAPSI